MAPQTSCGGDNQRTVAPQAGAAAAVVSHPADLLLTRLCGSSQTTNLAECVIAEGVVDQMRYLMSLGLRGAARSNMVT